MTEPSQHLSLDEIDAVRSGEGTDADAAHVASCSECQAVVADLHAIALELRRSQAAIEIPAAVNHRILWLARKQAATIKRGARSRLTPTRWAVAATLLLAIGAAGLWRWVAPQPVEVTSNDFDGNGRVDILDAFALARALKDQTARGDRWDLDHDGRIDDRDVELIARAAVALGNS